MNGLPVLLAASELIADSQLETVKRLTLAIVAILSLEHLALLAAQLVTKARPTPWYAKPMGHGVGVSLVAKLAIVVFPVSCLVIAAMRALVPVQPRAALANRPIRTVKLATWETCILHTNAKAQACGAAQ